jgi:drug/metabolite transporter (DMT)-like permease
MQKKTIGVIAVLIASLMWAVEPIITKLAYKNADFIQISTIRVFFVCIIGLIYGLISNKGNVKVSRKNLGVIFFIAIVGTILGDTLYFFSIKSVSVVNAVLIGHLQPIFVVIFGYFLLKADKLNKYDYFGIAIMIIAGFLTTTKTLDNLVGFRIGTFGDMVVLIATILWAVSGIAMRKYLTGMNAGVITFYRHLIASVIFLTYAVIRMNLAIPSIWQILIGLVGGIGTILYYEGMKRIKAAEVSALELAAPLIAAILGYFALGETVTWMQISGIVLVIAGVYFLSKKEN